MIEINYALFGALMVLYVRYVVYPLIKRSYNSNAQPHKLTYEEYTIIEEIIIKNCRINSEGDIEVNKTAYEIIKEINEK